jgi:hypothetical protein
MMVGLLIAILLLLLSATTTPVANAFSKLPPTCDESSDDKECAAFQIIVNQSSAQQLDNSTKKYLPEIANRLCYFCDECSFSLHIQR